MIMSVATDAGIGRLLVHQGRTDATLELEGRSVRCVLPLHGGALLCGTDRGLLRRESGPEGRWLPADGPVGSVTVTSLARGPATLWAGTEPSAVYRSADGGITWAATGDLTALPSAEEWSYPPRPDTHHVRTLLPHPEDAARLLAGIEAGAVVATADGGRSWLDRRPTGPRDPHVLRPGPRGPHHALAAAGDGWHESRDFGLTWTAPREGMEHHYVWDAALRPHDGGHVVLAVAASDARAAHGGGAGRPSWHLYRRQGEGPWTEIRQGVPAPQGRVPSITALPDPVGGFALCTQDLALFMSDRAGAAWRPLDVTWPAGFRPAGVRSLAAAPD